MAAQDSTRAWRVNRILKAVPKNGTWWLNQTTGRVSCSSLRTTAISSAVLTPNLGTRKSVRIVPSTNPTAKTTAM